MIKAMDFDSALRMIVYKDVAKRQKWALNPASETLVVHQGSEPKASTILKLCRAETSQASIK